MDEDQQKIDTHLCLSAMSHVVALAMELESKGLSHPGLLELYGSMSLVEDLSSKFKTNDLSLIKVLKEMKENIKQQRQLKEAVLSLLRQGVTEQEK